MDADLVSVRMLIASPSDSDREMWQEAAALASTPIETGSADGLRTAQARLSIPCDILVLDAAMPEPERSGIVKVARAAPARPFIAVAAADAAEAKGVDADGLLLRPTCPAEARFLLDRLLRVRVPIRTLIVDDSITMRRIIRRILAATRFPVEASEAEDGAAALDQIRHSHFDLVLLDYIMPGLHGLDALAAIKRQDPRLEVVMISSLQGDDVARTVCAAGASAFLRKPFFPSDVEAVLRAFCGMRAAPG